MKMGMRMGTVAAIVCGLGAWVALAEDLGAVQKKIVGSWEKQKSMTAKMNMLTRREMGGMVMESKGDGTYEFLRKGEKLLARVELKMTMLQKTGDQENKMDQQMSMVVDGEFAYTVMDGMGRKMAYKSKIDKQMVGDPAAMFEEMAKNDDLKLLPDETLDGKKLYVISATPKEKGESPATTTTFYFEQDSGNMVKMLNADADGKPLYTMTYSDIKRDVDINPERFVFKAPEGVEVVDRTAVDKPATRPAKPDKPDQPAKPEKPEKPDKPDKPEKPDKAPKPDKP